MITVHSTPRHLLSLLVMLFILARGAVEHVSAQGIPLPSEIPRAGTYMTPVVKARATKPAWRSKGAVIPAQAEESALAADASNEPTIAPLLEEPAGEMQYLRAPANAAEAEEESETSRLPTHPLSPQTNPLRRASRSPPYVTHTPYQRTPASRSPYRLAQNPAAVELDVEVESETLQVPAAPRVIPPQMLQEMPSPRERPQPPQAWQVAPGQRYSAPPPSRFRVNGETPEQRHDWPAEIQNPTLAPREQYHDDQANYPDEQVPGEELYGLPRVFETDAYGRFSGRGEPLTAGSWLNRPYYIGGFIGGLGGDTLVEDEIKANGSFFWGGNLGWDYDPYWGLEMRLAFSSQGIDYAANPFWDNAYNDLILWDTSLLYYPWGDARWRPYFKLGVGFADFDYTDVTGIRRSEMVYEMPFGFGMKYRVNQYWTWRFDVTDNLIFGGNAGMATQNQFSLAGGLEFRFGGRRQSYWPWNPSRRWR